MDRVSFSQPGGHKLIRGPGWLSSVDSSFCGLPMATFSLSILTAETERQKKTETEKDKDRETDTEEEGANSLVSLLTNSHDGGPSRSHLTQLPPKDPVSKYDDTVV